ncbi:hypothetical protein [Microcoleus vaginatus]|uniref:hypothetical protein n=1 Tax=Microcoleus vaginatus TaxID=119532 RepID=UPI004040CA6A
MVIAWLGDYCTATPGVDLLDNATVRLDADNEPQGNRNEVLAVLQSGLATAEHQGFVERLNRES